VPWLAVRVSPSARRTQADGLHDGALRVRLAAPPVDGKANALLVAWLATELGLPQRAVRVVRGELSRRKWVAIDADPTRLSEWLTRQVGTPAVAAVCAVSDPDSK
jgi:uncharacterized protein (TIGR00251 family)